MTNLIAHAMREFKAAGYEPIDGSEDGPDKWIQENVLELLELFSSQDHSGLSAGYCVSMFEKLARFGYATKGNVYPFAGEPVQLKGLENIEATEILR